MSKYSEAKEAIAAYRAKYGRLDRGPHAETALLRKRGGSSGTTGSRC